MDPFAVYNLMVAKLALVDSLVELEHDPIRLKALLKLLLAESMDEAAHLALDQMEIMLRETEDAQTGFGQSNRFH